MTNVRITENHEKNGIEIWFEAKPGEKVRTFLKTNGFRWSRRLGFWYAKNSHKVEKAVEDFELRLAKADAIHVERVSVGEAARPATSAIQATFDELFEGGPVE